eukprot:4032057-Amphidinium_carterae.1
MVFYHASKLATALWASTSTSGTWHMYPLVGEYDYTRNPGRAMSTAMTWLQLFAAHRAGHNITVHG